MKNMTVEQISKLKVGDLICITEDFYNHYYGLVGKRLTVSYTYKDNDIGFKAYYDKNINTEVTISNRSLREGSVKIAYVIDKMKFRVKDVEHSKRIQEYLFSIGCKRIRGGTEVNLDDVKFIYVEDNGYVSFSRSVDIFENDSLDFKEAELVESISYQLQEVEYPEQIRKRKEIEEQISSIEKQLSALHEELKKY